MEALAGRVCFVTGGGSGIGRATVQLLLAEGALVFVLGRDVGKLDRLVAECDTPALSVLAGSVADEAAVSAAFAACAERLGPVDVLINNAGCGVATPDLSQADLATFETMVDANLRGVFLCVREALKTMLPRRAGQILTVVSMAGQRTNPGAPIYCASKFGARGLSSALADQVGPQGIRVTDVNPGPVDTAYWGDRDVPREKFLSPGDVAAVIRFVLTAPPHLVIREINFDSLRWLAK